MSTITRKYPLAIAAVSAALFLAGGRSVASAEPSTQPTTRAAAESNNDGRSISVGLETQTTPESGSGGGTVSPIDWAHIGTADEVQHGYTLPSDRRELSFATPGIVGRLDIKEGQTVTFGQELAALEDREDRAELEGLRLEAESHTAIHAAELTLAAKKVEVARVEKIYKEGAVSDTELEKARLERDLAEQDIVKATEDHQLKVQKYQSKLIHVERMTLKSPIPGDAKVEKIDAKVGELASGDRSKPVYVVVKNDPLWIEVFLPVKLSQQVRIGEKMGVSHDEGRTWETANVILIATTADASSGTQMVRLQLANSTDRSGGLQVWIKLPPGVQDGHADAAK